MRREIHIVDYGKDFGFGRFGGTIDTGRPDEDIIKIGTNDPIDLMMAMARFLRGANHSADLPDIPAVERITKRCVSLSDPGD